VHRSKLFDSERFDQLARRRTPTTAHFLNISNLLAAERVARGTRRHTRALTCFYQALMGARLVPRS
jgi:hypothetical protein